MNLKGTGREGVSWIQLAHSRVHWQDLVNFLVVY
jgi:hypothetical protein